MKKKVYLWGAGDKLLLTYSTINHDNCEIIAIIDSNETKQNTKWLDKYLICNPEILLHSKFDYIVVTVKSYAKICQQIDKMGIDREKIICFWNKQTCFSDIFSYVDVIEQLDKEKKQLEYRYLNLPYERCESRKLMIKSSEELLKKIINDNCSLVRFGDGEFEMIFQKERPWFQKPDKNLAQRLRQILNSTHASIQVAIADNFGGLDKYTEEAADAIREYMVKSRKDIEELLDFSKAYYNAYVTRPYLIYKNKNHATKIFSMFKQLWKGRNLLIVEGKYSKIGVENDLFSTASCIRRIICPEKNAWEYYDRILEGVLKYADKNELVCVSLGPTATVLCYDLAVEGYQSIDLGQLDTEYEWYLRKTTERICIPGKLVAEMQENYNFRGRTTQEYDSSIVYVIE